VKRALEAEEGVWMPEACPARLARLARRPSWAGRPAATSGRNVAVTLLKHIVIARRGKVTKISGHRVA
jgi:hypothetical protein